MLSWMDAIHWGLVISQQKARKAAQSICTLLDTLISALHLREYPVLRRGPVPMCFAPLVFGRSVKRKGTGKLHADNTDGNQNRKKFHNLGDSSDEAIALKVLLPARPRQHENSRSHRTRLVAYNSSRHVLRRLYLLQHLPGRIGLSWGVVVLRIALGLAGELFKSIQGFLRVASKSDSDTSACKCPAFSARAGRIMRCGKNN